MAARLRTQRTREQGSGWSGKIALQEFYKFYGQPGERIQLFYEDIELYYPYDIYKFNKIE